MRSDGLPEGWTDKRVGDLTLNLDRRRVPLSSAERASRTGPYPYWGANGPIDSIDAFLFQGPHILVAEDGNTVVRPDGRGTVHWTDGEFWVNNHAHVLRAAAGVAQRWLFYALANVQIRPFVTGSAQPKVNQSNLNAVLLPTPPRPEQQRIAWVLASLDDKIENNRRVARTLDETVATLFKARFVDFVDHDDLVESEVGRIPHGWKVAPVGDVIRIVGGSTPSTKNPQYWDGGTHAFATPKDLSGLASPVLQATARQITDAGVQQISSKLLPKRTVLLSSRAPIGYTVISNMDVAVNQGFIAIPPSDVMPSEYVLFWLRENMDRIKANAGGTTFAEISKRAFRPLLMLVPPATALAEFEGATRPLIDRIAQCDGETRLLSSIRDRLLPRLISGDLRVASPDGERAEVA